MKKEITSLLEFNYKHQLYIFQCKNYNTNNNFDYYLYVEKSKSIDQIYTYAKDAIKRDYNDIEFRIIRHTCMQHIKTVSSYYIDICDLPDCDNKLDDGRSYICGICGRDVCRKHIHMFPEYKSQILFNNEYITIPLYICSSCMTTTGREI